MNINAQDMSHADGGCWSSSEMEYGWAWYEGSEYLLPGWLRKVASLLRTFGD